MNEELPQLIEQAHEVVADAGKSFGHLNSTQLNWQPNADQWSVAQCLEHLIVINSAYFPRLQQIESGNYEASLQEKLPVLPRLFGSLVLKAVQPETPRKLKADRRFQPASSDIGADIVDRFKAHQRDVIGHMEMMKNLNLKKVIVTSPVASIATYSLLDAYKIIVAHEQRHVAQAKRVVENHDFPK
jgi:hypothetical protein